MSWYLYKDCSGYNNQALCGAHVYPINSKYWQYGGLAMEHGLD